MVCFSWLRVFGTLEGHDWNNIWKVFVDALDHPDELLPQPCTSRPEKAMVMVSMTIIPWHAIKKNAPLFWEIRKDSWKNMVWSTMVLANLLRR